MATLVSPGVSITIEDFTASSVGSLGTVPFVLIASGQDKKLSNGTIAAGTTKANAGKLFQFTTRASWQAAFGDAFYETNAGTVQQGSELNEHGVFAGYSLLSLADRVLAMRADINVSELAPTIFEPRSPATNGTVWHDISQSEFGIFKANGSSVAGLAWDNVSNPYRIESGDYLEMAMTATMPFANASSPVITIAGQYSIVLNGVEIKFTRAGANITLQDIADGINASSSSVIARIFRLASLSYLQLINFAGENIVVEDGADTSMIAMLGLDDATQLKQPVRSVGGEGDIAIDFTTSANVAYQKLRPKTTAGETDSSAILMWFAIGSDEWYKATPTVVTSAATPTFPLTASTKLEIRAAEGSSKVVTAVMSSAHTNVTAVANDINAAIINARNGFAQDGTTPLAGGAIDLPIVVGVKSTQLVISNYNGGDIVLSEPVTNATSIVTALGLPAIGVDGKEVFYASHSNVPAGDKEGSIWFKTTDPNLGASLSVKRYSTTSDLWNPLSTVFYANDDEASVNIGSSTIGTLYVEYNVLGTASRPIGSFAIKSYRGNNVVTVSNTNTPGTGGIDNLHVGDSFAITAGIKVGNSYVRKTETITLDASVANPGSGNIVGLSGVAAAINEVASSFSGVISASIQNGQLSISNNEGLSIKFSYTDASGAQVVNTAGRDPLELLGITEDAIYSNWEYLSYTSSAVEPTSNPTDGTMWYNENFMVDIMVNDPAQGDEWLGYRNVYPNTDPNGVILGGSEPLTQTDGSPLVANDLWVDTTDLENYPKLYRFNSTSREWESVDTADQTTPFGIVFADARWTSNGQNDGSRLQGDMLTSNFVDPDAPDARTYPGGMLLFNTRYSTYNVKEWNSEYFSSYVGKSLDTDTTKQYQVGSRTFNEDTITDENKGRWVTKSGNQLDGAMYAGRKAQRVVITRAMQAALSSSDEIRAESLFFNLMATPGYPELIDEMAALNIERGETALVVGDVPFRKTPTTVIPWATNRNGAATNGEDGLISSSQHVAIYYANGLASEPANGYDVMIPGSINVLRSMIYSDSVTAPWFGSFGIARGAMDASTSIGYISSEEEYVAVELSRGHRDAMYLANINPVRHINGAPFIWGNKTRYTDDSSALSRVNVVRLTHHMRITLDRVGRRFIGQPNDATTWGTAKTSTENSLAQYIAGRGIRDYAVVCDASTNDVATNPRDLNIEVAVRVVQSVEFVYFRVQLQN